MRTLLNKLRWSILEKALEIFENTNLSLEDCYNIVFARKQGIKVFKTFDKKLDKIAKALLEKETLDTDEFEKLVGKKKS